MWDVAQLTNGFVSCGPNEEVEEEVKEEEAVFLIEDVYKLIG